MLSPLCYRSVFLFWSTSQTVEIYEFTLLVPFVLFYHKRARLFKSYKKSALHVLF